MKDKIKELRITIDSLHRLTDGLDCNQDIPEMIAAGQRMKWKSKQVKKASDSLLMSKYWLGESLKAIGAEVTPDISHQDLEAFLSDGHGGKPWGVKPHLEKIAWLINEIQSLFGKYPIPIVPYRRGETDRRDKEQVCIYSEYCWKGLAESTFWLDEELKRL